jgi:hypothetical protein
LTRLVRHDTDLWSAEAAFDWPLRGIRIPVRMTVMRLGDGSLVLHSPIALDAALRAELDALGPVGSVVVPYMHGAHAEAASRHYPKAQLLAAPTPPRGREGLPFAGSLADDAPAAWKSEIESRLVAAFRLHEVLLLHRPTRTLVITDLCFNVHRADNAFARLFFVADGMWRRFGPSYAIRWLGVSNRAAFRRSLERVLEWDFERILPAHGEPIERGGRAALRAAWRL